ncbi:MAG: protein-L-isoaspartate(D-aspartate) O-methyltransferase [Candidatus Omnitrophica bacterium]|nr:protein-L-isoaspartate(D-aspartate) O-methyltransferase [Candidatus Omnitrophota bacterium]MCM8826853.1 protein-L-isoaspartate(D-aspartate) O-methyltransferase [Candidatus Omnitrophota bacterium]
MSDLDFKFLREQMVARQLKSRGINDDKLLYAFSKIPRELFVPQDKRAYAYDDSPLPIGLEQTISQPYIVAVMTQALKIKENDKVLEIGTGSGYQSAILAELGAKVYSVERLLDLSKRAKEVLDYLGYRVNLKVGDGTLGWLEFSPYDKIIVTAAGDRIPQPLFEQLKIGGRMVIPLGERFSQNLTVIDKLSKKEMRKEVICGCIFVPLIGDYGYKDN